MCNTCLPIPIGGILADGIPTSVGLKSIKSAKESWPEGIKSMTFSNMYTNCCTCVNEALVFCLPGFKYKHGLASLSNPKITSLPVSFSAETMAWLTLFSASKILSMPNSRLHANVNSILSIQSFKCHLVALKYLKKHSLVSHDFSASVNRVRVSVRLFFWSCSVWAMTRLGSIKCLYTSKYIWFWSSVNVTG